MQSKTGDNEQQIIKQNAEAILFYLSFVVKYVSFTDPLLRHMPRHSHCGHSPRHKHGRFFVEFKHIYSIHLFFSYFFL